MSTARPGELQTTTLPRHPRAARLLCRPSLRTSLPNDAKLHSPFRPRRAALSNSRLRAHPSCASAAHGRSHGISSPSSAYKESSSTTWSAHWELVVASNAPPKHVGPGIDGVSRAFAPRLAANSPTPRPEPEAVRSSELPVAAARAGYGVGSSGRRALPGRIASVPAALRIPAI